MVVISSNQHFSPAREAMHSSIIERTFNSLPAHSSQTSRPFYLATWGGPNSAKSVVINVLKDLGIVPKNHLHLGMHLFEDIPEFLDRKNKLQEPHPEKSPCLIEEYYYLIRKIIEIAKQKNISIIFDDHGDQVSQYAEHVQIIKGGLIPYETILLGQAIEPNFFLWYIKDKITRGRNAKIEYIPYAIELFQKLTNTFPKLLELFDSTFLNESHIRLKEFPILIGAWTGFKHIPNFPFNEILYKETVLSWLGVNNKIELYYGIGGLTLWNHEQNVQFSRLRRGDSYFPVSNQTRYQIPACHLNHIPEACKHIDSIAARMLLYYAYCEPSLTSKAELKELVK